MPRIISPQSKYNWMLLDFSESLCTLESTIILLYYWTIVVQFCDGELVWHLWSSGQEGLMGVVIRMEGHCTTHTLLIRMAGHCSNTQLSKPLVLHYKRLNHTPEIWHSNVQRCTLSCIYFEHNTTLIQFISCTPESKSDDDWCRVCEPENCHLPSSPKILKYEMWSGVSKIPRQRWQCVIYVHIWEKGWIYQIWMRDTGWM